MTDRASLPDFELPATGTQRFQLSAFKGHPFSDAEERACAIFGVMKMKNMYGRQVRGMKSAGL